MTRIDVKNTTPAIALFDIETSPNKVHVWNMKPEYVGAQFLIEPSRILCYAAKWLGRNEIAFGSGRKDDKAICIELHQILSRADIVIAHNGKAFDIKTCNARFLYHGLVPPAPYRVVDTCLLARKAFNLPHNSLAGIAQYLKLGAKKEHEGFGLWLKCLAGDNEAWKRMQSYNINDVTLLEKVYMRLRPWDRRHPSVGLLYEDALPRCVICGSTALKRSNKVTPCSSNLYELWICKSCGKPMRAGKRVGKDELGPGVMKNVA